jgi:hypothetical protein
VQFPLGDNQHPPLTLGANAAGSPSGQDENPRRSAYKGPSYDREPHDGCNTPFAPTRLYVKAYLACLCPFTASMKARVCFVTAKTWRRMN